MMSFSYMLNKAAANARKHGVTFEVASTVFRDPQILTVADLEHNDLEHNDLKHNDTEERWFSIGWASNGTILSIVYLWLESDPATQAEIRRYTTNTAYE
jgi:uncharacterized protein